MSDASPASDDTLSRWKKRKLVAYVVAIAVVIGGLATFADSVSKLISTAAAVFSQHATAVIIPNDTGWIFAGYYDDNVGRFTTGPFVKVVKSSYPDKQTIPRIGEWVRMTAERNVVIADFASKGLTRQMDPPWQQNQLGSGDYTGIKLPKGSTVEVRDVSAGSFPGRPSAVWLRIGSTH
jgi:hypothetical protein